MIGIVVSTADDASAHVAEHLFDLADWEEREPGVYRTDGFELREFEDFHLHLDRVAEAFDDPDCVVFASRHSGETGRLLSAHYTGNFGQAEYGGANRDLSTPCPGTHRQAVRSLAANAPDGWDVAMECTHHGPTDIGAPAMYVELGSDEAGWQDPEGAAAVARSILSLDTDGSEPDRTVVGFGGSHYAPRPTRLLLETDVAVGHVAADWSLDELGAPDENRDLIERMFAESGASMAVFDGDYPEVESVVEDLGYRVVSERWLRETTGIPGDLVDAVERRLDDVASGLRFGARRTDPSAVVVRSLPDDLLGECETIDAERTREIVEAWTVAYETAENGNRIEGSAAFVAQRDREHLVDDLIEVLQTEYDAVKREESVVVAERTAFDPEAAQAAGVPEGPKFGQLAAGQPVEVDGERISPERVQTRETRRFTV
ncbi:D-aminoacyl-tRNA deacylase [Halanaeroarchaeum sulfurireducens]|uniref:D-aminoacyl-tRNA deacylase n=1 Tax=Halanaeroarchaeum sulfurireducens TaxID=1604004 RepID=A0A0F7PAI1_9EURY|nr:D-aminoacyl-tRNA deacylase [Halanaeroarchaeum sulfurireducens]AKH97170.1 D-aminoacyl-tRNA deacylase [Halanaeroarchaeum sulfurireducens]ALG81571.1 D-aminoacyl-tRNA deacylase [Halanaeroarchaeum sulfurireducens]